MPGRIAVRERVPPPLGSGVALIAFGALAWLAAADPWPAFGRLDVALSAAVRAPVSTAFDRIMVAATLLGDFPLTLAAMLALTGLLFARGPRALALHALALFVATKLVVSAVKIALARERPLALYPDGDVYSFPSGHTASAAVLLGVVAALFLARRGTAEAGGGRIAPARVEPGSATGGTFGHVGLVAAFALPALAVALSRVRLGAHWPSDVLASLVLVAALLLPFVRHARRVRAALPERLPWLALGALVALYALYAPFAFGTWLAAYTGAAAGG